MADRPLGVTIICILGVIGALLGLGGSIVALLFGGALAALLGALGAMVMAVSVVTLIISIVTLIAIVWLWQMKKRGWTIVIILEIISIILNIASMNIGLIIPLIIVVYLWMKKGLFK